MTLVNDAEVKLMQQQLIRTHQEMR